MRRPDNGPTAASPSGLDEARVFLESHPGLAFVDLLIPDIQGVIRGKRINAEVLPKVAERGLRLPGSVFAMDGTGENVEGTGLIFSEGEKDRICRLVPGSLAPVPWAPHPTAQALLAMFEEDGRPFFADPRHVLEGVLARYRARGLTPVIAVELEFYLFDRERDQEGRPRFPVSPVSGRRLSLVQCFGMDDIYQFEPVLHEIAQACAAQGIPAETAVSEYAPAQFEINLHHLPDAVRAADHGVLLKRAIKSVAAKHGLDASFMAKPLADSTSSGTHIHFSLLDESGRNVFDDGSATGSALMRHALGGLMATAAEAFALFAPNANSFRRFGPGTYAPISPAWGLNNRTTGLRIPPEGDGARRIEHRFAGADAHPHLVVAAVLAGALHGLENRLDPGPPVEGNAYAQVTTRLPITWDSALDAFAAARVIPDYLGSEFCRIYGAVRRQERDRFQRIVTPLEYEWYLLNV